MHRHPMHTPRYIFSQMVEFRRGREGEREGRRERVEEVGREGRRKAT